MVAFALKLIAAGFLALGLVSASPVRRAGVTALSSADINSYNIYTYVLLCHGARLF
jgi:hypothetical protein